MTYCKHCSIDSATLKWQAERIEELEAELAFEREADANDPRLIFKEGIDQSLTPTEGAMLSLLMTRPEVSNEELFRSHTHRGSSDYFGHHRTLIKAQICRLRAKLRPLGLSIETIWGYGYRMPQADRRNQRRDRGLTNSQHLPVTNMNGQGHVPPP